MRDDKTSPLVRDSGLGGCGTQTPSVTNPPTYFYKRPVNDLQATEQGQGAKKINGNCKLHTKANNKLRQSRKNISPPAKKK